MKSNVQETRKKYEVIVNGKPIMKFYSNDMKDDMVYRAGDGSEYLCKGNQFIKLINNSHDTYRNFTQI